MKRLFCSLLFFLSLSAHSEIPADSIFVYPDFLNLSSELEHLPKAHQDIIQLDGTTAEDWKTQKGAA